MTTLPTFAIESEPAMGAAVEQLLQMLARAIDSARPETVLPHHLPPVPKGRTLVLGAGKAAATMARTLEQHWPAPLSGLVVTAAVYDSRCQYINVMLGGYHLPNQSSLRTAMRR